MRVLVGPLVAIALAAAGCGGSSKDPQTKLDAPAAPAQAPGSRQFQAFANCLRDHGVDLPQLGRGGPPGQGSPPRTGNGPPGFNPQDPDVRKAFQACRDKLPQGAGPGGGPPGRGAAPPQGSPQ